MQNIPLLSNAEYENIGYLLIEYDGIPNQENEKGPITSRRTADRAYAAVEPGAAAPAFGRK